MFVHTPSIARMHPVAHCSNTRADLRRKCPLPRLPFHNRTTGCEDAQRRCRCVGRPCRLRLLLDWQCPGLPLEPLQTHIRGSCRVQHYVRHSCFFFGGGAKGTHGTAGHSTGPARCALFPARQPQSRPCWVLVGTSCSTFPSSSLSLMLISCRRLPPPHSTTLPSPPSPSFVWMLALGYFAIKGSVMTVVTSIRAYLFSAANAPPPRGKVGPPAATLHGVVGLPRQGRL